MENSRLKKEEYVLKSKIRKISEIQKKVSSLQEILETDESFWKYPDSNISISNESNKEEKEKTLLKKLYKYLPCITIVEYKSFMLKREEDFYTPVGRGDKISQIVYNESAIESLLEKSILEPIFHNNLMERVLNIPNLRKKMNIIRECAKLKGKSEKFMGSRKKESGSISKEYAKISITNILKEFFIKNIYLPLNVYLDFKTIPNPLKCWPHHPFDQKSWHYISIGKSLLYDVLNYYELCGELLIENLKINDIKASRIARNYANIHKINSKKDNAFLKVYSKNLDLKEKETKILDLLKNKKIGVPQWYCHGNLVPGLYFMLQERIEGEPINEFILNNAHNKKGVIKSSIDQLVKIHESDIIGALNHLLLRKPNSAYYTEKRFVEAFLDYIPSLDIQSGDRLRLIKSFEPIAKEISKLENGIYIDANPSNILIDQNNKVYNVDFENIKRLPYQFDLAIFCAGLGLSDEEQTEIIDYYLEQKCQSRGSKLSKKERRKFYRGYNLVNILRNLTLAGNMQDYIEKYEDEQALEDQKRYFKQAKKAIARALHSEYMTEKDKTKIENFNKKLELIQFF